MAFKPEILRSALGCFATGVTVMSITDKQGRAMGVTANSFASVSLEPALILWCLRREAVIHEVFENNDLFAVNFLGVRNEDISTRYAMSGHILLPEDGFTCSKRGVPLMKTSLTSIECKTIRRDNGGDHTILLAEIFDIHNGHDGDPLIFYKGRYRQLEGE